MNTDHTRESMPGPDEGPSSAASQGVSTVGQPSPGSLYFLYGLFFKIRGALAALPLFVMFFFPGSLRGNSILNCVIGLSLFGAAFLLRIRSQQYLRYRLRQDGGLATAGPYAWVRNPVYIANTMGLGALCILCNLNWMAPLAMAWSVLVYHLSVCFEEMRLIKRFGEPYACYLARTPRWIPRRPREAGVASGRASFWKAARVEWQNVLLLLVPLGKHLSLRWGGRDGEALPARLMDLLAANKYPLLAVLSLGLVLFVTLTLRRLASAGRRNRKEPARAE